MDDEERRHLGATFDLDAEGYDAGRPDYPAAAWAEVLDHLALTPTDRVLEIGPGTGQATGRLLDTGATVHAIEPGAALAELLRTRYADRPFSVETSTLEAADLPEPFDTIAAATSFHWVDPDVGVPMLRRLLRPGGRLALWWNVYRDPAATTPDPVDEVVRSSTRLPNTRGLNGILDELDLPTRLVDAGFAEVEHRTIRWQMTLDEPSLIALFASFSDMRRRTEDERDIVFDRLRALVRDHGGTITRPATTPIVTAVAPA